MQETIWEKMNLEDPPAHGYGSADSCNSSETSDILQFFPIHSHTHSFVHSLIQKMIIKPLPCSSAQLWKQHFPTLRIYDDDNDETDKDIFAFTTT
jgi:hypothetical protein